MRLPRLWTSGGRGKAWLLFIAVAVCVTIPGFYGARALLRSAGKSHEQPEPHSQAKPPTTAEESIPEPSALPSKPQALSSEPADPEELKKETFKVVRQLMVEFPRSSDPIVLMGNVHHYYGNSAEAVKWWVECLQRDPRRADMYYALGMVALRKGESQEAAELCRKAQEINPNLPGVYRGYAQALLEMGKVDEALAALEKEIRNSPGVSEHYILLGTTYLQRKEYEKAVGAYTRALEIQPHDSKPYYGLATACARLGQGDKARQYMEKFGKLRTEEDKTRLERIGRSIAHPNRAANILSYVLIDAGRLYYEHRRLRKAEEYWRRAARLNPENTPCREQLVDLYRRTRRRREAVEVCEQLRKIDPKNATYHLNTGVLLAELRRFDAAEGAMRKAIELAPKRASPYRSLVRVLLFRNQKLPEAKALAQKLVELEPTARHYSLLSEACSRNQDRAGALAAMKRAAELAPADGQIQRAYKRLQERQ